MPTADFAALCAAYIPSVVTGAVTLVMGYVAVSIAAGIARGRHA
jgi:hypothetical protein